jgi:hypothetical protein
MTIDLLEKWIALMADEISEKEAARGTDQAYRLVGRTVHAQRWRR